MSGGFDRVAGVYRALETVAFGAVLQRARTAFVGEAAGKREILIVGEGNGRFLAALREMNPTARVTVVDASEAMLRAARRRAGNGPTRFWQADVREDALADGDERYDLVVTHFLLDCFDQEVAEAAAARIGGVAAEGATWLIAEFAVPAEGGVIRRAHARVWLWVMYAFFGVTTGLSARRLPDVDAALGRAGFVRTELRCWRWGLVRSMVWRRRG